MKKTGLVFSGEFDWVQTSYIFPTNRMVAPKNKSLSCNECHDSSGSRLANLNGLYMPGRDRSKVIDSLGWIVVFGSMLGVGIHGLGRIFTNGRNGRKEC